jgi:hypothetical protein
MTANCKLCGEPMPPGEEMFFYHGFSCDCPSPPLKKVDLDPAGVPKVDLTELERVAVQIINHMKALSDDGSIVLPLDIQMHIDAFLMTVTVRRIGVQ